MYEFKMRTAPSVPVRNTGIHVMQVYCYAGTTLKDVVDKANKLGANLADCSFEYRHDYDDIIICVNIPYAESDESFARRQAEYEIKLEEYNSWRVANAVQIAVYEHEQAQAKKFQKDLARAKEIKRLEDQISKLRGG